MLAPPQLLGVVTLVREMKMPLVGDAYLVI